MTPHNHDVALDGFSTAVNGITDVDRAIHEPARMLIMAYLSMLEEADFVFLKHETNLTHGNLSSHLSKLEDAGYIAIEKQFVGKRPRTILRMTVAGRAAFNTYRSMLRGALDALDV